MMNHTIVVRRLDLTEAFKVPIIVPFYPLDFNTIHKESSQISDFTCVIVSRKVNPTDTIIPLIERHCPVVDHHKLTTISYLYQANTFMTHQSQKDFFF